MGPVRVNMKLSERYLRLCQVILITTCLQIAGSAQINYLRPRPREVGPLHDNPALRHSRFLSGRRVPTTPSASLLYRAYRPKLRNRTARLRVTRQAGTQPAASSVAPLRRMAIKWTVATAF
jgi:hypothetical protein